MGFAIAAAVPREIFLVLMAQVFMPAGAGLPIPIP